MQAAKAGESHRAPWLNRLPGVQSIEIGQRGSHVHFVILQRILSAGTRSAKSWRVPPPSPLAQKFTRSLPGPGVVDNDET